MIPLTSFYLYILFILFIYIYIFYLYILFIYIYIFYLYILIKESFESPKILFIQNI